MSRDALPPEDQKRQFVHAMFAGIARRYDLLNGLLSAGFDRRWRTFTAKVSGVRPDGRYLDVCCGTGDLALALSARASDATVIGSDFVYEMLELAQSKVAKRRDAASFVPTLADTLDLPFADDTFDAATVGFGIRNVANVKGGIAEMARVVKPGGKVVILEFTQPRARVLRDLYMLYFTKVLPRIGNAISNSDLDAYSYLPASVLEFPNADELASLMRSCGLTNARYHLKTFGIVAVHVGEKG